MFDSILKSVPFQLLFRGTLPGGFFVFAYVVATEGWSSLEKRNVDWSATLAVAAFSGVVIYTVHRSLVYPFIEAALDWNLRWIRWIQEETTERLKKEWRFGAGTTAEVNAALSRHFTAWNDYIHLQYASLICIVAGSICGACRSGFDMVRFDRMLFFACAILGLSAFIGDIRRGNAFSDFRCESLPEFRSDSPLPLLRKLFTGPRMVALFVVLVPLIVWILYFTWLLPRQSELTGDSKFILVARFFAVSGLAMTACEAVSLVLLWKRWSWLIAIAAFLNLTPLYYAKVFFWGPTVGNL